MNSQNDGGTLDWPNHATIHWLSISSFTLFASHIAPIYSGRLFKHLTIELPGRPRNGGVRS